MGEPKWLSNDEYFVQARDIDGQNAKYATPVGENVPKAYSELLAKAQQLVSDPPITIELPGGDLFAINNVEEYLCSAAKCKVVLRGAKISRMPGGAILLEDDTIASVWSIGDLKPVYKEYELGSMRTTIGKLIKLVVNAINGGGK